MYSQRLGCKGNLSWEHMSGMAVVAFAIGSGGAAELAHLQPNVRGIVKTLGYSLYFLTILSLWKVLGTIVIGLPRCADEEVLIYAGVASTEIQTAGSNICFWH